MTAESSSSRTARAGRAHAQLDDIDLALLRALEHDARISNKDLAAQVGVAPSTCHARIRSLVRRGVLRGFHAEVDLDALGRGLQALVAVRLHGASRARLSPVARDLSSRPEVREVYLLGGAEDLLVHVAVEDSAALRAFVVEHLSTRREVAHTQTSLVFEHLVATPLVAGTAL